MKDGLYRVDYKSICAGFVVEGGRVVLCAPVLRKRLEFWKTIATLVEQENQLTEYVVNIRSTRDYDVYIGRSSRTVMHWGNPFTHQKGTTLAQVQLKSRGEAVAAFKEWINGGAYQDVEPERRTWMLKNLHTLKGKVLGCYCAPLACHGDILSDMANKEATQMYDITQFNGKWYILSNFAHVPHGVYGYPTNEHFFQAMKTHDKAQRDMIKSLSSPGLAKRAGRSVALRSDWEEIKDDVMITGLRAKFTAGSDLAVLLQSTGDVKLVEGNYWHDIYWGVCNGKCRTPHSEPIGKNILGEMLMHVRTELNLGSRLPWGEEA